MTPPWGRRWVRVSAGTFTQGPEIMETERIHRLVLQARSPAHSPARGRLGPLPFPLPRPPVAGADPALRHPAPPSPHRPAPLIHSPTHGAGQRGPGRPLEAGLARGGAAGRSRLGACGGAVGPAPGRLGLLPHGRRGADALAPSQLADQETEAPTGTGRRVAFSWLGLLLLHPRPGQHAWEHTGSHGPSRPHVHPEDLHLSQEGPDPVEHRAGGGCGTPSPPLRGGTTEPGSPPRSPSIKLADRTESPNRSVEKSDRVKRSPPAPPVSAIDARLQRYTQAAQAAGRALRPSRQTSIDLPGTAVASARSLWETGEGHTPPAPKTPPCKDIVAGDMSKRSLWEGSGGGKTSSTIKSTPAGRRYRFVAAGHGKYEKVFVDEDSAP